MGLLRKYWLAAVILVLGAAFTYYIGLRSESTLTIIWSGATVGILTGIAVGAANRQPPANAPRRRR